MWDAQTATEPLGGAPVVVGADVVEVVVELVVLDVVVVVVVVVDVVVRIGGSGSLDALSVVPQAATASVSTSGRLATATPVADHVQVDAELRGCPIDTGQLLVPGARLG